MIVDPINIPFNKAKQDGWDGKLKSYLIEDAKRKVEMLRHNDLVKRLNKEYKNSFIATADKQSLDMISTMIKVTC